jgi:5'-3' exonuclease
VLGSWALCSRLPAPRVERQPPRVLTASAVHARLPRYGERVPGPLLVVDAPSMLFRAFYALPSSIKGPEGHSVNALLGATNLILREVEQHRPRAVVLCFGPDAAEYLPEELIQQWGDAGEFFGAFGWTVAVSDDLEADDLLNSFARREAAAGGKALLLTGDRDMFQCATSQIRVLYVSTGVSGAQEIGPAEVRRRYGIPPKAVPDFIALRGDPSDGLPGAKGIGEKTAAELLRRHRSLEGVLEAAFKESRAGVRTALLGARDELLAFKEIATLRNEKVRRPRSKRTDYRAAAKAARRRGMNRLADRLEEAARR